MIDRSLRPANAAEKLRYSDEPSTPLWYPDPTGHRVAFHLDGDLIFRDRQGTALVISSHDFQRAAWMWRFTPTQSGASIRGLINKEALELIQQLRGLDPQPKQADKDHYVNSRTLH
jgi:hypothetical protein